MSTSAMIIIKTTTTCSHSILPVLFEIYVGGKEDTPALSHAVPGSCSATITTIQSLHPRVCFNQPKQSVATEKTKNQQSGSGEKNKNRKKEAS